MDGPEAAPRRAARTGSPRRTGVVHLSTKVRAAHRGRNPATGEAVDVPAKKIIVTKAAKNLRDVVAGSL